VHFSGWYRPFSRKPRVSIVGGERGHRDSGPSRFKGSGYGIAADAEALGVATNPSIWKLTPRQMSALLFIRNKRRTFERIEFVSAIRMAMHASRKDLEKAMERWARDGEITLTFED
jgi:hypothetical protein